MIKYIMKKYALSERGAKGFIWAVIACAVEGLALMLPVSLLYYLTDDLLKGAMPSSHYYFYGFGIAVALVLIVLTNFWKYNATYFTTYRESGIKRVGLAEKLRKLPLSFFGKKDLADLTNTVMGDVQVTEQMMSHYVPQFWGSIISALIVSIGMFAFDWRMALAALWVFPVALVIVAFSKKAQNYFQRKQNQASVAVQDGIQECLDTVRDLKSNNAEKKYLDGLNKKIRKMEGRQIKSELGSAFHVAMNGASAGKKIISLLNTPDPIWGTEQVSGRAITLDNVTFSYDGKRDVLKGINMTFPEKGMTAIVGESGCGKSTVVNMLVGALRPKEGSVTVGGKTLESLSRDSYYAHLAVVSYNTYIFNQTVRENFALANGSATDEQIYAALESVNLAEFIRENGGLDKVITEDANNISGGQKQRLALAVNLVADKDIYVFDEATSNIDVESEAIIMRNIKALSADKSVIVISHRLANVVPADNIYFMENGEVKESGAHTVLMSDKHGYEKLFTTQKQLEEGYAL